MINLTPHPLTLITEIETMNIPPEPTPARCAEDVQDGVDFRIGHAFVPVRRVILGEVTGLPAPRASTLFFVSRPVAEARPDRSDLVIPFDLVRDDTGRIIGCRELARVAGERAVVDRAALRELLADVIRFDDRAVEQMGEFDLGGRVLWLHRMIRQAFDV